MVLLDLELLLDSITQMASTVIRGKRVTTAKTSLNVWKLLAGPAYPANEMLKAK